MPETEVVELPPVGSTDRPGVTVVTNENFNDYVDEKIGAPAKTEDAEVVNDDPEAVAAAGQAKIDEAARAAPKEGDVDGSKVFFNGKWVGKHDFNYRLHVKTEEANKAAQAKVDAAAADAKSAKDEREALIRERDELKAKYEPPKSDEIGPEPTPAQFTDITEYSKALKDWTAEATRKADAATRAAQAVTKGWNDRLKATKEELPDYAAKVDSSPVKVSEQMREAIIESEVGPKILYHFAEHPEVAEALGKLTVRQMLVQFGKLEATLGSADKPQTKSAAPVAVAEISKAPAPITPLRGGGAVTGTLSGSDPVPKEMSYEEWKKRRLAGKIK